MRKLQQTRLHESDTDPLKFGNCFPTVIACYLDKDSAEDVIQIQEHYNDKDGWMHLLIDWLDENGRKLITIDGHLMNGDYYLVTGLSPRGVYHICIYQYGKLYHDPHPSNEGLINEKVFENIIHI